MVPLVQKPLVQKPNNDRREPLRRFASPNVCFGQLAVVAA
jgi:hypothetical protein